MNYLLLSATLGDKFDVLFANFDLWIYHIFGAIQSTFMTGVADFFTSFGDERFVIPFAVFALVLCFFKRSRKYGITLLVAVVVGTALTNVVLKPLVLRLRPYNTLQANSDYWQWYIFAGAHSESDYSFPSGHTTAAFELAVGLSLCLRNAGHKKLSFLPCIAAFLTGCSRIYLMVHYPTDVIAGVVAGTIAGFAGFGVMLIVYKLIDKNEKLNELHNKTDLEKPLAKGKTINRKISAPVIAVTVVAFFLISYIPALSEGGEDAVRCAYSGEDYTCYNEAKTDDEDYPAIDGKCYCKIHWKQLNDEN